MEKAAASYPWYGCGKKPGEYRPALARGIRRQGRVDARVHRPAPLPTSSHWFTPHGWILRVRVSTDAKTVGWRLGRARGAKPPIRPPRPGSPALHADRDGERAPRTGTVTSATEASLAMPPKNHGGLAAVAARHAANLPLLPLAASLGARSPTPRNWLSP
jgi:hypothetical protein